MKHTRLVIALLAGLTISEPLAGTPFDELLAKALAQTARTDFDELRAAYVADASYNPYGHVADAYREHEPPMMRAGVQGDWADVLTHCKPILEVAPLDLHAHFHCAAAYRRTGDEAAAKAHDHMFNGLRTSLLDSGDGRSPATAYKVVTLAEEKHLFILQGWEWGEQSLVAVDGIHFDRISATADGESFDVYFNVQNLFDHDPSSSDSSP